ncbi:DUF3710 domain-containing protein [Ornithinimicrobium panacihumi]|uniref:DUF3710 domain-containing protein n=1 Tax=Ornithinimicrobium panacihumi TaxID=2008449 RepID=UPI003F89C54B
MALFGRKKRDADAAVDLTDEGPDLLEDGTPAPVRPTPAEGVPGKDRDWDRAGDGPYDITEWPELDGRIDLGALRLPAVAGMQMRLDLEQGSDRVVGATLTFGPSHVQLQAFAAPRTIGIWDELRPDIARSLVEAGGAAETEPGVLGKELRARMPGRAQDGRVAFQPARFLGVDGPRWFLRIVVNGPAAADDAQLAPILEYVRKIVVKRGDEPRPPREVLVLTPPAGVMEAAAQQAQARRQQAARAAAAKIAQQAPTLRKPDATGVAGISASAPAAPQAAPAQGGPAQAGSAQGVPAQGAPAQPAPGREPDQGTPEAPRPPSNPEFT